MENNPQPNEVPADVPTSSKPEVPYHDPFIEAEHPTADMPFKTFNSHMTTDNLTALEDALRNNTNISSAAIQKIVSEVNDSIQLALGDDLYSPLSDVPTRGWGQVVDYEGRPGAIRVRAPSLPNGGGVLAGRAAIDYMNSQMTAGVTVVIPLWNSGITVMLGNIPELAFMNLIGRIHTMSMELGANTRGAAFSGDDASIVTTITDFILDYVISATVKGYTPALLKDIIRVNDIPVLLAGALSSIYPKGYPHVHTCVNVAKNTCDYGTELEFDDDGKIKVDRLVDFKKIVWNDIDKISLKMRKIVMADMESVSLETITAYQDERVSTNEICRVVNKQGTTFVVNGRVPTLNEYRKSSNEWIQSIISSVNHIMSVGEFDSNTERKKRRIEEINVSAESIATSKHIAWVSSIVSSHDEDGVSFTIDKEALPEVLSGEFGREFGDEIASGIKKFKESSTLSVVGMPSFICPKCGSGQSTNPKYPSLIPLNMVQYFFSIGEWRRMKLG